MLLDICPITGRVDTFDYDHSTGGSIITSTENVDGILDANAASYNQGLSRDATWRGDENDFWHVGRVPLTELQRWLDEFNSKRSRADKIYSFLEENPEWEAFMYGRWNDPDYKKLKTAPVRI